MRYINKALHKNQGEKIVTEFLERFFTRKNVFPSDFYNAFSSEIDDNNGGVTFRDRLRDSVLLPEQQGLCCYCLRRLDKCKKITVEHLMRNHAADKAELDTYRSRPTALDGIPHSDEYRAGALTSVPPHPHSIAYQNLVLSCDGDFFKEGTKNSCCNLKRLNKFIPPLPLYSDIDLTFVYHADGMAEWTRDPQPPESQKNAVKILKLNNSILKMVRRIWFFCKDNGLDPRNDDRNIIVNTMIGYLDPLSDVRASAILRNFKKANYWNLLLEYEAFFDVNHC